MVTISSHEARECSPLYKSLHSSIQDCSTTKTYTGSHDIVYTYITYITFKGNITPNITYKQILIPLVSITYLNLTKPKLNFSSTDVKIGLLKPSITYLNLNKPYSTFLNFVSTHVKLGLPKLTLQFIRQQPNQVILTKLYFPFKRILRPFSQDLPAHSTNTPLTDNVLLEGPLLHPHNTLTNNNNPSPTKTFKRILYKLYITKQPLQNIVLRAKTFKYCNVLLKHTAKKLRRKQQQ